MARITTYFSGKDDLQAIILGQLAEARSTIHVAVAWFTDTTLFQKLLERQRIGVKVELIITDHIFNDQSANNYKQVEAGGGLFLKLGSDAQLMHHKFCIVDRKVLLQWSFNWTKRANQSNNETLTLIEEDPASVNQFLAEYERLKQSAGVEAQAQELRLAEAFKYFQLIRAFIGLGKSTEVNTYAHEMKGIAELEQIVALLIAGDYQKATEAVFCGNILPRTTTSIKRHCLWPQGGDRRSSIPRRPAGNKLRLSAGQLPGNSTSRPLS